MSISTEQRRLAAIMFTDMVGYTALSQRNEALALELLEEHRRILRSIFPRFNGTEIKTIGDAFLVEFQSALEAAQCALEIQRTLAKRNPDVSSERRIELRIGIHVGDVVHREGDVYGDGVNIASRIQPVAGIGGICISVDVERQIHHALEARFEKLAPVELKNVQVPMDLFRIVLPWERQSEVTDQKSEVRRSDVSAARSTWARAAAVVVALLLIGIAAWFLLRDKVSTKQSGAVEVPAKSIAVLPFENLSRDPDNAYFATGIQDEILTRLAKIGALKVISRTSTQQYAARPGNLSEIARQLGVAHILEGSVQKAGDQVHINAQLIRATTDEHLWAESYDRKIENIFGVEAEVATAVAEALKAELTGAEHRAVEEKPTSNPKAYDAYLRGLAYALRSGYSETDTLDAIKYLSEAVDLDPKFALAWTWLARESSLGYFNYAGSDVPKLHETAKHAAEEVAELQPDRSEAYLAKGYYQYYCDRDYNSAIASFDQARQLSPGNSDILQALGYVWRRKGEWQRSLRYFQEAIELDPRNISLLSGQADAYWELRQYSTAIKGYDRILEISPDDSAALAAKAGIYQSRGDLPAAATLISRIHLDSYSQQFYVQIQQWVYERRYTEAIDILKNAIAKHDRPLMDWQKINYTYYLALLQQFSGDAVHARETWQQVKTDAEKLRATKGEEFELSVLVEAYAVLGDETKALATLDHAAVLGRGDPLRAAFFCEAKARIAVQAGDRDLALKQLEISAQNPVGVDHGDLKFNPLWDPLRGDPRFEKILASLAAKRDISK